MMMRGFVKIQTAKVLCLRLQCLERIRADVLKFTTGTEGQVNKMSDDLISRKELAERLDYYFQHTGEDQPEHYAFGVALKEVKEAPVAFDKEKVIEELQRPDPIIRTFVGKKFTTIERAIEIVEKGGIG